MYDEESMDFIISKVSDGFWILEQKGVRCFLIYSALSKSYRRHPPPTRRA